MKENKKTKRFFGVFFITLMFGMFFLLLFMTSYSIIPTPTLAAPQDIPLGQGGTCQTWTSKNVPKFIPDNNDTGITSLLPVAQTGYISSITVTFTISHEYPSDLKIDLCPPGRTSSCPLLYGDLTSTAGIYTVAFSSHPTHSDFSEIYDGPPYTGSYPVDPDFATPPRYPTMTGLIGKRAAGVWRLNVADTGSSDVGSLTAWNLQICTLPSITATPVTPGPTSTTGITPTALPAAGIYLFNSVGFTNCGALVRAGATQMPDSYRWDTDNVGGSNTIRICNMCGADVQVGMHAEGYARGWSESLQWVAQNPGFATPSYYFVPSETVEDPGTCTSAEAINEDGSMYVRNWFGWGYGGNYSNPRNYDANIFMLSDSTSFGLLCEADSYHEYAVSRGACPPLPTFTPTITPTATRTPRPTFTPACGTPVGFGWWWMW